MAKEKQASYAKVVQADTELGRFALDLCKKHGLSFDQMMYLMSKQLTGFLNTHTQNLFEEQENG